jgi:metal-sulfur cluster biosynthetic enzyme
MEELTAGMTPAQYDDIIERLSTIEDPEVGVNIVDLGLIYDMVLKDQKLFLSVTLTSMGCPLQEMIEDGIHDSLLGTHINAEVMWTFSPPWNTSRMTDDGREMMIALGAQIPNYG